MGGVDSPRGCFRLFLEALIFLLARMLCLCYDASRCDAMRV